MYMIYLCDVKKLNFVFFFNWLYSTYTWTVAHIVYKNPAQLYTHEIKLKKRNRRTMHHTKPKWCQYRNAYYE